MALIIKDENFILSDSGLEKTGLVVAALPGSWMAKNPQVFEITPQVNAFASVEKAFESVQNYLRVEGFPTNWKIDYFYGVDNYNFVYWLDLEIKEKILVAYPDINPDNIEITTEPVEIEPME